MGSEAIEVVERRRWSAEEKLKVLTDALAPGASITAVSERHGVARNLIYTWLRLAREGRKGRFLWPVTRQGSATLTPAQLSMLLEGIDWRAPQRTWQPSVAG